MCREYRTVGTILKVYDIEAGCTCPILVKLDNECRAVFKYPRNPQGLIVLLNEYVTGQLAHLIDLTSPDFGIAVVNENTTLGPDFPAEVNRNRFSGVGFYSLYIPKTVPASLRALKYATNLGETARIILLDQIVKNCDRHEGNLLLTTDSSPMIFAIDHSHAFGDPEWTIGDLSLNDIESPYVWRENLPVYNMLICAGASVTPAQLEIERNYIQAHITEDALNHIFATIPPEWINDVGAENISHLHQYILNRVQNLEAICNMINQERGV